MGLTFLNPALIGGFFALAVPLFIHLLNRRSPKDHPFPTIQFLRTSVAHKSRIHRLRQWILLLVRTLLVAAVVAAFCRPELDLRAMPWLDRNAPAAVVLLMDVSASMGAPDSKGSPLSRAQAEASSLLRSLRAQDAANVVYCGAGSEALFPEPGPNLSGLLESIGNLKARPEAARASEGVVAALDQVSRSRAPRKEIHIFSDFQRTNWSGVDMRRIPPDVLVTFVNAGQTLRPNQSVIELKTEPAVPVAGMPFALLATIANYSDASAETPVSLNGPQGELANKTITLEPWSTGTVVFTLSAQETGPLNLQARLPADAFPLDDVRQAALHIRDRVPLLLVTDEADPESSGADSGSFYILHALSPRGEEEGAYVVRTAQSRELREALAAHPQVAIITNVGLLNETACQALVDYVRSGGSLFWFLSPGPMDTNQYNLDKAAGEEGFFPFTIGAHETQPADSEGYRLNEIDTQQPPLQLFKSPENGDLTEARFFARFQAVNAAPQARVLARYQDGVIAAGLRSYGEGRILMANFTPSRPGTDWPTRPTFLPFLHECLAALRAGSSTPDYHPGEILTLTLDGTFKDFQMSNPAGQLITVTSNALNQRTELVCREVREPGIYTISRGGAPVLSVAVNVDPQESDLRCLSTPELTQQTDPGTHTEIVESSQTPSERETVRRGKPLWHLLIALALAFAGIEQGLSALWKAG